MRAILYPSEISGRVAAPPSKSMAHRALICAALAKGESRVLNLSASQDITATLAAKMCIRDSIETDQMKRYRVATRFVQADGECTLFWNKEETL